MRRWIGGFVTLVGLLAGGVWLWIRWDEAQAREAWEAYRRDAEGRGVKFELRDFLKPPIPDDKNFAASPLFEPLPTRGAKPPFTLPDYYLSLDQRKKISRPPRSGFGELHQDLENQRQYFEKAGWIVPQDPAPTPDALWKALARFDAEWSEFLRAAAKPRARFFIDWEKGSHQVDFRPLFSLQSLAKFIFLRAQIRLAQGQPDEALAEWRHLLRLEQALTGECGLAIVLVKSAPQRFAAALLRQGLEIDAWTDQHLDEMSQAFGAMDPLADYAWAVASERAILTDDFLRGWQQWLSSPEAAFQDRYLSIYHGLLEANRDADHALSEVDVAAHRFTPKDMETYHEGRASLRMVDERRFKPYRMIARSFRAIGRDSAAYTATLLDQARVVCALERHRRAHGAYPGRLDALVPTCFAKVPHDIFDGQPLRYRRTGESFLLYSVGPDGSDQRGRTKSKSGDAVDWAWHEWAPKAASL